MRNLVFLLFMGVVVFFVAGWFLDWYDFTGVKNGDGKTSIQFDINRDKIKADLQKGTQKFNETVERISDEKKVIPTTTKPVTVGRSTSGTGWSPVW